MSKSTDSAGTSCKRAARPRKAAPKQAREPRLTYRKVIDTAIDIAREHSITDVTIRAVATRLSVSPMALYKHVGGKGELEFQIAFDIINRALHPERIDPNLSWDEAIRRLAHDLVEALKVHPTILRIFCEHPFESRLIAFYERLYQAFESAGIPVEEHRVLGRAVVNYLIGSVMMRLTASEVADQSFLVALEEFRKGELATRYSHVAAALEADRALSLRGYEPALEELLRMLAARRMQAGAA